jgi:hypothetical protein
MSTPSRIIIVDGDYKDADSLASSTAHLRRGKLLAHSSWFWLEWATRPNQTFDEMALLALH